MEVRAQLKFELVSRTQAMPCAAEAVMPKVAACGSMCAQNQINFAHKAEVMALWVCCQLAERLGMSSPPLGSSFEPSNL